MKQTAVEWLVANIDWQLLKNTTTHYKMIVEKAKEMEKANIIDTWYDCKMSIIDKNPTTADEYYNKTFKSK